MNMGRKEEIFLEEGGKGRGIVGLWECGDGREVERGGG
jgi:hypothetical protein